MLGEEAHPVAAVSTSPLLRRLPEVPLAQGGPRTCTDAPSASRAPRRGPRGLMRGCPTWPFGASVA
eukprot:8309785-Pyramimonas_sp.AAC.1